MMLLRGAARRWAGARLRAAQWAIVAFDAVLLAGYVFSFSEMLSWLHIPPRVGAFLAAGALAYLLFATAWLVVRAAVRAGLERMPQETDAGRRRVLAAAGNVVMAAPVAVLGY